MKVLDQASFTSVKAFADDLEAEGQPISILVANIGVALQKYRVTNDGWEETYAIRHYSRFVFLIVLQSAGEPPFHRTGNNFVAASLGPSRQGRVTASNCRGCKLNALLGGSIRDSSGWRWGTEILERQPVPNPDCGHPSVIPVTVSSRFMLFSYCLDWRPTIGTPGRSS